jgi:putative PEP-CTERM system histidine kinase
MSDIGAVSYAIGGGAFLVLSVLLAVNWRGHLEGGFVLLAAASSAAWCFLIAYQVSMGAGALSPTVLFEVTVLLEVLRGGAWLSLLVALLRDYRHMQPASRSRLYAIHGLGILALSLGVAAALEFRLGFPVWTIVSLAIALAGLILLEQLYRNATPEGRWAIKFLVIGIGGIFAYDLVLYSQALLFRGIDVHLWNARGAANALAVPLIAVAAARNPDWAVKVFVSRQVVFYTTALIGAGIYLLAIAAGGYYVRFYGGNWGAFAQAVLLAGGAMTLMVLLLSVKVRARVRVFLVKHFFKSKYDYRREWLRLTLTLAAPDDAAPLKERALQGLAQLVESPGGSLWLGHERGDYRPAAQRRMEIPSGAREPADSALVRFLQERGWVIDLEEWRAEPSRYENLELPTWLCSQNRAWLVVPLLLQHRLLGFAVLLKPGVVSRLNWEDTDLLKTAGRQVASTLAQERAAEALAQAQQFDAYHRLTAFIMHDFKNLIAQQSLVLTNATRHKDNPAFVEDVIRTVENCVTRMNQLLEQLRRGEAPSRPRRVGLGDTLREVVARYASTQPEPVLQLPDTALDVLADPQGLATILGHVVRNAQEATARDGHVQVRLHRDGTDAIVEIEDDGAGMDPAFVAERLFRPFDTTKGTKGMGIGAFQVREFVHAAGGEVDVVSAPGAGTLFRIILPVLDPQPERRSPPEMELRS